MADRGQNVYEGTPIVWADVARLNAAPPTATDLMTLLSLLATPAGQVGAQHDLGAKHRPRLYKWRLTVQFDVAIAIGEIVEIYVATAEDGAAAQVDGNVGQANAAVLAGPLRNCMQIGTLSGTVVAADVDESASGIVLLRSRYVSPIVWNATSQALRDQPNHEFTLTPIFEEDFEL